MKNLSIVFVALLLAQACESERSIGSTCVEGRCAQTQAPQEDPHVECAVSAAVGEVAVDGDRLFAGCLPTALVRSSDGTVTCKMVWDLSATSVQCSDLAFAAEDEDGRCLIDQAPVVEGEVSQVRGWFYEDGIEIEGCSLSPAQRVTLTADVQVPEGTRVALHCALAWAEASEAAPALGLTDEPIIIDPMYCEPPRDEEFDGTAPSDLGQGCMPLLLEHAIYDDQSIYVNLGSNQCDTGACLVYHLDSQTQAECIELSGMPCEGQAAPDDGGPFFPALDEQAICSCRCDGAPAGEPECACADGFTCLEVLSPDAPPEIAGSYCVPSGLLATP